MEVFFARCHWWKIERNLTCDHFCTDFPWDRDVQWNVWSRFRPHPRISESEASFLVEFTIKFARKLLV